MEKLVSVVIPTYNRKEKLIRAIESVLNQTYRNIEIIVIDDNSDFNVQDYLNTQSNLINSRIKVIRNESNLGPSLSRNKGAQEAQGEFVAFLDSDDIFLKNKIQKQVDAITQENADFCYCGWSWIDEETNKTINNRKVSKVGLIEEKPRYYYNIVQDLLVSRNCFQSVKFLNNRTFENYDFILSLSSKFKSSFVEDVLVNCYHHFNSRASDIYVGNQNILIKLLEDHKEFLKNDKNFVSEIRLKIFILSYRDGDRKNAFKYLKINLFSEKNLRTIYHLIKWGLSAKTKK